MSREEKCFTFTWKLENVSYCLQRKDEPIYSPDFVVDSIDDSKWFLSLYPRGEEDNENYVSFYLFRRTSRKWNAKVSIKYELAFVAKDGSALISKVSTNNDFPENLGHGIPQFEKRDNVFNTKRSEFLPKDTLTARCRIWKTVGVMTEDVKCFARTRIDVDKRSFLWNIRNFSTLDYESKYRYEMKSLNLEKHLMSVNLSLTDGLNWDEVICFELNLQDQAIKFTTLVLSLVDVSENMIECNREEFWFDEESKSKKFKFFYTKDKLMEIESSYLPNDILSLHWEWTFSKGIVSKEKEDAEIVKTSYKTKFSNAQNLNDLKMLPLSYPLNDNLKSLYDENFLCDVKLKTESRNFNAHKVILSASSSVFKAMFSSDMKEKESNCINIEDLSDDTVGQMLTYIYTARIEDLTWEKASQLYTAADKYAIFSLKNICSSYIKDYLSPSNACDALLLSVLHADGDLKSFVQDYIFKHVKDTVSSDGWKLLMQTNPTLAAETLSLPYK